MITGTKTKNKTRTRVRTWANTAAATNKNNKPPWSKTYIPGVWILVDIGGVLLKGSIGHPSYTSRIPIDSLSLHCWLNFCWKHIKHFICWGVSSWYFVLWWLGNPPWKSWPNWSHNGPWRAFTKTIQRLCVNPSMKGKIYQSEKDASWIHWQTYNDLWFRNHLNNFCSMLQYGWVLVVLCFLHTI